MTLAVDARFTAEVGAGESRFAVDVELALSKGVLVLFGPSGCGKSVTLQALVGSARITCGHVSLGGEPLVDVAKGIEVPSHQRRIGYVPQHHALFPFCDVTENVTFGLPRPSRHRIPDEVEALIEEFGIAHLRRAMPQGLSGGERQRVALARALAVSPRLLVLDEPFASIDRAGKDELLECLATVLERRGMPAVLVTHDPREARRIGHVVVRFERGRSVGTLAPEGLDETPTESSRKGA
jgi:molybdate transport system ATP-binding protein